MNNSSSVVLWLLLGGVLGAVVAKVLFPCPQCAPCASSSLGGLGSLVGGLLTL